MIEKEYLGERREAMLWAFFSVMCMVLAVAATTLGLVPDNVYVQGLHIWSFEYWTIILGLVFCGLSLRKIAHLRGTSIRIAPGYLIVTNWAGQSYKLPVKQPLFIDRNMTLALLPSVSLTIPIPIKDIYRIKISQKEVYINLESCPNADGEIRIIQQALLDGI